MQERLLTVSLKEKTKAGIITHEPAFVFLNKRLINALNSPRYSTNDYILDLWQ
jgi:hypothetical protein